MPPKSNDVRDLQAWPLSCPYLYDMDPNFGSSSGAMASPIAIDHATLRSQEAGTHTRYTVSLTGRPDEAWYGAYAAVCDEAGVLRNFPVDRGRGTVSFSCRVVEGPAHVIEMLEKLEEVLTSVERRLGSWQTARSADSGPMLLISSS